MILLYGIGICFGLSVVLSMLTPTLLRRYKRHCREHEFEVTVFPLGTTDKAETRLSTCTYCDYYKYENWAVPQPKKRYEGLIEFASTIPLLIMCTLIFIFAWTLDLTPDEHTKGTPTEDKDVP